MTVSREKVLFRFAALICTQFPVTEEFALRLAKLVFAEIEKELGSDAQE